MTKLFYLLPAAAILSACGGGGSNPGDQLKIVGSSTVYPFTTAVAEEFQRARPGISAIVESTGTGAGIKLFCGGVGSQYPDMVNASRPMKKGEYDSCAKAGVKQVIEVPVGIDGLTFIEARTGPGLNLTTKDIYEALAADPYGKGPNTAQTWQDVNPALPAVKIRVLGPPPTSGTRDSLAELILEKGCGSDPAMAALKKSDEDRHKQVCTKIREDGAYVEAGENDNLIVQKLEANANAFGIFGFSFLDQNADKLQGHKVDGVEPTFENIASGDYGVSRSLFIYAKKEHVGVIPGMAEFIAEYTSEGAWGPDGYLADKGLIPLPDAERASVAESAKALKGMGS